MSKSRKQPSPAARGSAGDPHPAAPIALPQTSAHWFQWLGATVIAALAIVLLAMLAAPWWRGDVYTGGDLQSFNLPIRKFYADCLERGDSPLWWPYVYCGFNLHGDGQTGIYHPWHRLLYGSLRLIDAFNLEMWINYPLLFVGTYLFCRRRQLPIVPALFGAFLFAFCRFNVNHIDHPNLMSTMTHVPWLLWATDVLFTTSRCWQAALAALGVALLTGSQFLLGHPQSMWFTALVGAWYVAAYFRTSQSYWRLAQLGAALVCGLAIGAVQWLPTYEALKLSQRAGAGETFRSTGGMHPLHLIEYLAPSIFNDRIPPAGELIAGREWSGAHELYLGMFLPVAFVWLVIRGRAMEPWRGLAWASLALGFIGVALALGKYYGPLHWIVLHVPVVGLFRSAFHTLIVASLGFSLLAACVLADVLRFVVQHNRISWNRLAWLTVVPLATLALSLYAASVDELVVAGVVWHWAGFWPSIGNFALAVVAVGLFCLVGRGHRWAPVALMLFTAVDAEARLLWLVPQMQSKNLAELTAPIDPTARDPLWRVWMASKFPEEQNQIALQGGRQPSGYVALAPRFALLSDPELERSHPDLLQRLTSTRWVIKTETRVIPGIGDKPMRLQVHRSPVNVPGSLPRIRLVTSAVVTADPARKILEIDPASVAIVEHELRLPSGPVGRASFVRDRPGYSVISTDAPSEQLLVFGECWHPAWKVTVDGRPAQLVRTYCDFMGCIVPAGYAKVQFRYEPRSVQLGSYVSLAGLGCAVLLCAGAIVPWRRATAATMP